MADLMAFSGPQRTGLPVLTVKINRPALARLGLSVADVQGIVEAAVGGAVRIGVERDVGDRVARAGEELRFLQLLLHDAERLVAALLQARQLGRLGQEVAAEGPIERRRRRARYLIARAASDLVAQRIKEGADGKLEALSDDVLAGRIRPEDAAKELVGR